MNIDLFDYPYPEDLIAQQPLQERSASRLMVLDPQRQIREHRGFHDFVSYFGPEDLLVFNEVRVTPSRLYGKSAQGRQVEVLLLEQINDFEWACLVRPANKLKAGGSVSFGEKLNGTLSGQGDEWVIKFVGARSSHPGGETPPLHDLISAVGLPPLPPYIKRDAPFETKPADVARYQTVYAKAGSAAAAPTAGFHFTEEILRQLQERGCEMAKVTLHVSRDTFQPVRTQNITEHRMHGESYEVPAESVEKIIRAKQEGRRITAIGTTTVRTLESAWNSVGAVRGFTKKFIYPGYEFRVVDRILTNFHQPKSTLLMLVAAFAGREFILAAYQSAVEQRYRLFSYGDAMLLLNRSASA